MSCLDAVRRWKKKKPRCTIDKVEVYLNVFDADAGVMYRLTPDEFLEKFGV